MYLHHQKCKKHIAQYTSMKNIALSVLCFWLRIFRVYCLLLYLLKDAVTAEINVNSNQIIEGAVSPSTQCLPTIKSPKKDTRQMDFGTAPDGFLTRQMEILKKTAPRGSQKSIQRVVSSWRGISTGLDQKNDSS